jgi:hypothetical protein
MQDALRLVTQEQSVLFKSSATVSGERVSVLDAVALAAQAVLLTMDFELSDASSGSLLLRFSAEKRRCGGDKSLFEAVTRHARLLETLVESVRV